jgi:hypothetical protein
MVGVGMFGLVPACLSRPCRARVQDSGNDIVTSELVDADTMSLMPLSTVQSVRADAVRRFFCASDVLSKLAVASIISEPFDHLMNFLLQGESDSSRRASTIAASSEMAQPEPLSTPTAAATDTAGATVHAGPRNTFDTFVAMACGGLGERVPHHESHVSQGGE